MQDRNGTIEWSEFVRLHNFLAKTHAGASGEQTKATSAPDQGQSSHSRDAVMQRERQRLNTLWSGEELDQEERRKASRMRSQKMHEISLLREQHRARSRSVARHASALHALVSQESVENDYPCTNTA